MLKKKKSIYSTETNYSRYKLDQKKSLDQSPVCVDLRPLAVSNSNSQFVLPV